MLRPCLRLPGTPILVALFLALPWTSSRASDVVTRDAAMLQFAVQSSIVIATARVDSVGSSRVFVTLDDVLKGNRPSGDTLSYGGFHAGPTPGDRSLLFLTPDRLDQTLIRVSPDYEGHFRNDTLLVGIGNGPQHWPTLRATLVSILSSTTLPALFAAAPLAVLGVVSSGPFTHKLPPTGYEPTTFTISVAKSRGSTLSLAGTTITVHYPTSPDRPPGSRPVIAPSLHVGYSGLFFLTPDGAGSYYLFGGIYSAWQADTGTYTARYLRFPTEDRPYAVASASADSVLTCFASEE